ncbi:MAG TPA: DMT family transporter [Verrucomicrobiae bacterium]|nr:DMT family transporter [Verrucomicrobiae bacterium]
MPTPLFLVTAFLMGVILSVYLPMNSSASRYLGSSIAASFSFFVVATATCLCILLVSGQQQCLTKLKTVPPYLHIAGIISAFFIIGTTFLVPKIGARTFFILLVSGQILMAIVISHFGLLESPQDPVNLKKLAGALLVIAGAVLSVR